MINLRTAPARARAVIAVTLSAAAIGAATWLIAAPATSATAATAARTTAPATTTATTTTSRTTSTATTPTTVSIKGKTSQRRPISLTLSFTVVTHLRYRIEDRCPRGRHLFVHAWGFPPLPLTNSHFGGTFKAKRPAAAAATIKGKISGARVSGLLSDRTKSAKTHRFCAGKATFDLAIRQAHRRLKPTRHPKPHAHSGS